jgi:hypothetical protein
MTTTRKPLNDGQSLAMMRFLAMAVGTEDGWVSEYQAREGKVDLVKLRFLVRAGYLVTRQAPFLMPAGPYAGETMTATYYQATE